MEDHANVKATRVVVAANIALILTKLSVVLLTGSIGVLAVLVDSGFDLVGSLIAYFGVKKGSEPADTDHLYGHKKYESMSSLAQLSLIAITAALIIGESVRRLVSPVELEITSLDLVLMFFTVIVDIGIVFYLRKNADSKSSAIQASVGNYTSDIFQNSMVFIGLAGVGLGFHMADPIAALVVAGLMLRVVHRIGTGAFGELTDASPPKSQLQKYADCVMGVKGVKSFHRLRARQAAGHTHLDLHIQLDPKMTLEKSHAHGHEVKRRLMEKFPEISDVLIHVEPLEKHDAAAPKFGS